jgi:ATP:ADP antiporter, AAA family
MRVSSMLRRIVDLKPGEATALLWSFAYFFCLLCSYYILRPLRDEMGIEGGVSNLQWVFSGTFVAMLLAVPLFGALAARLPRHRLLPLVYYFFSLNLLVFFLLLKSDIATATVARAFFIWVSVFNLFVVSVFWSYMADLYNNEQARRLFGFIAAGGSAGAVVGPLLTASLARSLGIVNLLLVSAALLLLAIVCIRALARWAVTGQPARAAQEDRPIGGGVLSGVQLLLRSPYLLGICVYILLYTMLSTFLYFEQARIVADTFSDSASRARLFALMDLGVNALTILGQVLVTARIIARFGVSVALALIPAAVALGFLALAVFPVLAVLVAFQIVRRAGNFAIARPTREILYTVVSREQKYKSKNFIDTVVYRGGDAISGWLYTGLTAAGLGLSAIALVAVPVALAWLYTGAALGRKQEMLRSPADRSMSTQALSP